MKPLAYFLLGFVVGMVVILANLAWEEYQWQVGQRELSKRLLDRQRMMEQFQSEYRRFVAQSEKRTSHSNR